MAGQNAGTITYDVTADTSKLKAEVSKATGEVNAAGVMSADAATEATNRQAAATSTLGDKLKDVKRSYGEQIEVVQGLIGKIAAIGAIAVTAYKVGQAIRQYIVDALEDGAEKAKDFAASLNFNDSKKSAEALTAEIQRVEGELAAAIETADEYRRLGMGTSPFVNLFTGEVKQAKLKEQLAELNRKKEIEQRDAKAAEDRKAAEKKAEDDKKAAEKAAADVASITEQARREAMTEEEKIAYDAETKIAALIKAFNAQSNADRIATEKATYEAMMNIADTARAEIEARRKASEDDAARKKEEERKKEEDWWDKIRKHQEEQEQRAKQTRESWSNAYRAIREESNRAFATDQAASMVQFASQLRIEGMTAAANMNRIEVQGIG